MKSTVEKKKQIHMEYITSNIKLRVEHISSDISAFKIE